MDCSGHMVVSGGLNTTERGTSPRSGEESLAQNGRILHLLRKSSGAFVDHLSKEPCVRAGAARSREIDAHNREPRE